jgi:hypothetical protein
MIIDRRLFVLLSSLIFLTGCSMVQEFCSFLGPPATAPALSRMRESAIVRIAPSIRPDLDRLQRDAQVAIATAHETVDKIPARYKRHAVVKTLKRPWEGLMNLEQQGLLAAGLAEEGALGLAGLLDVLEAAVDRTSAFHRAVPLPTKLTEKELVTFMRESLEEASFHRDKALSNLSDDEKRFVVQHAKTLVEQFTPQLSNVTEQTISRLKADARFAELLDEQVDYANLIAAAQVLARLANQPWLQQASTIFPQHVAGGKVPAGITGEVLHVEETPYGLIVIGGAGPNTYEMDNRFGLIVDIGGDDHYRGMIASSTDAAHGNAVVLDLSGNDTYDAATLGLATGRLGVGLLIDQAGDDVYQLDMGAGGTGFGGIGILFDAKGNDTYVGTKLTQGAAISGLGLLLDLAGNDRHTSHGFSIGFGGPQAIGAMINVNGDDYYQCGNHYPSGYNTHDAPNGKPGDPMFQYDCFGLGTGSGKRILTKRQDWQAYNFAGGWGLLLDIAGQDRYESANFSQGHGYYFGAGTLLDLDGDDQYQAARYGHGTSAHYGVGLLSDHHGDDRYSSSGPFYNGGTAWDHGVSLMLESGDGKDLYGFESSTGLGGADYAGWGFFIDEGGDDSYKAKSGFGQASEKGAAAFFDLKGTDGYQRLQDDLPIDQQPGNGTVSIYPKGGLFVDR